MNQQQSPSPFWHRVWRQEWLPSALRKEAYKKLSARGCAPDAPFERDFFGLRYQGNLNNGIEFAIYYYGAFEKPLLFFLGDALSALTQHARETEIALGEEDQGEDQEANQKPSVFLDVGANIGQHSLFMSRLADEIHAFEPYPTVANKFKAQLALNNIENVTLHEVGLSDENGKLPFFAPAGNNEGVGSFDSESQQRGNTPAGELEIVRGDDLFAAKDIERIDLMKIDVEGFERKALLGMQETLCRTRPVIVCEITYGQALSFKSRDDLLNCLPENYQLLQFNTRKANGRTARRRGAKAKRSGAYELIPLDSWRDQDQDDVVAVPGELMQVLPMRNA